MPAFVAIIFIIAFFRILSTAPQAIGVVVGIFAIGAVLSTLISLSTRGSHVND